jgi:hypothetical protein
MDDLPSGFKLLVGHGVEITFCVEIEGRMRSINGIVKEVSPNLIKLVNYSNVGDRVVHVLGEAYKILGYVDFGPMPDYVEVINKADNMIVELLKYFNEADQETPAAKDNLIGVAKVQLQLIRDIL